MLEPKVSILIPLYNHERYIANTIDSLAAQTYCNFECRILDDGSTDGSYEKAKRHSAGDDRFRVFSQANIGFAATLNRLQEMATGEYIITLDSDDMLLPQRLAFGVERLEREASLSVSFCSVTVIDENGQPSSERPEFRSGPLFGRELLRGLVVGNFLASCAGMIRSSSLKKVGPLAGAHPRVNDWDLWLRLSQVGVLELLRDVQALVRWDGRNMSRGCPAQSSKQEIEVSKSLAWNIVRNESLGMSTWAQVLNRRALHYYRMGDKSQYALVLLARRRLIALNFDEELCVISALVGAGMISSAKRQIDRLTRTHHGLKEEQRQLLKAVANKVSDWTRLSISRREPCKKLLLSQ